MWTCSSELAARGVRARQCGLSAASAFSSQYVMPSATGSLSAQHDSR